MISFKSTHYPRTGNAVVVSQEYALRYYIIFTSVVIVGVMIKIHYGQPIFWFAMIGMALALLLGNIWANIQLNRKVAEIFFVGDSYSLITIHEIVHKKPNRSFPLRLANPSRVGDEIHLHFLDQVIILKKEDWEDFELIWNWLQNPTDVNYSIV